MLIILVQNTKYYQLYLSSLYSWIYKSAICTGLFRQVVYILILSVKFSEQWNSPSCGELYNADVLIEYKVTSNKLSSNMVIMSYITWKCMKQGPMG